MFAALTPASALAGLVVALFAALLIWAAWGDLRHYIIPNRLSLAVATLYPIYVLSAPLPVDWLDGLMAGAGVLGATWILFALGFIGGGDAKLLSATALWAGLGLLPEFIVITTIIGGGVAGAVLIWRFIAARWEMFLPLRLALFLSARTHPTLSKGKIENPVPYGVAIAAGGLWLAHHMFTALGFKAVPA